MENKQLFLFCVRKCADCYISYSNDEDEYEEYCGFPIFKEDIKYLEALREQLGVEFQC